MPITFRCTTCNQKLSISSKKAGTEILCPKCTTLTRVPTIEEASAPVAAPASKPAPTPAPKPKPAPTPPVAEKRPEPPAAPPPKAQPPVVERKPLRAEPAVIDPLPLPPFQPLAGAVPPFTPNPPAPPPEIELEEYEPEFDPAGEEPARASVATESAPRSLHPAGYNPWADVDHDEDHHPSKRAHPPKDELDMTSLVDVTFLLLVFFMITASFSVQKFMQIASPESDENKSGAAATVVSAEDIVGESVVVQIDSQDRITVDDAPVAGLAQLKELFERKLKTEQKTDVLIDAAYSTTHGTWVSVTDMAMKAGMRHVRGAAKREGD